MNRRSGFTIIELVIVLGIIGVLSSIAIPGWVHMQRSARRAELPSNVSGIRTAEIGHEAAFDEWIEQRQYWPEGELTRTTREWPQGSGFDRLGWAPDGPVRGEYRVLVLSNNRGFEVRGHCDVDVDEEEAIWQATEDTPAVQITPNHIY